MIGRKWTTHVTEACAAEYQAFAKDISLPMLRQQPGFLGVATMRRGEECVVLPPWRDAESVASLARSASYTRTVSEILATGFLQVEQTLETYDVHLHADLPT
jgi:heme-degrading monooxygenase HmoA